MSLEIKCNIVLQEWMSCDQTNRLFGALQGDVTENEPQALFVGGCVRNMLLEKEVEDIDIATPLHPEHVTEILEREGIKVIPTGLKYGTVTAIVDGISYEITTLRHDVQTDGRRAEVLFTDSWVEDAKRRDFTINTLLLDRQGNVYDPLDQGLADIEKRYIRFVGDAAQRIEEDHLRILRFFRFSALYGDGFDKDGLLACKNASDTIKKLSKERVTQELFKIISSERPYDVLAVMFGHNVLKPLEFSDYDPKFFEHFCAFQSRYSLNALSSRLFVFAALNFENIKAMEEYILFPKIFLKDMKAIEGALNLSDLSCTHAVRVSIYHFGRSVTAQALMIELVQDQVMNGYAPKALEIVQNWQIPVFPVSGDDLIKAGYKQGSELGAKLSAIESWWIEQGFIHNREECLAQLF